MLLSSYELSGTGCHIVLRACGAMSGTDAGLSCYALPTRCQVLTQGMPLPDGLPASGRAASGTAPLPTVLRIPDAMSGTELGYAATHPLRNVRY
eukprot:966558-Rhodomonas_salina.1